MNEIIIVGAGAIGRGFLPWVFGDDYEVVFVDSDAKLVEQLNKQGSYTSYMIQSETLKSRKFRVKAAYRPADFSLERYPSAAAVFLCVGPRHCVDAARVFRGVNIPVILCENDPSVTSKVKAALATTEVFFAIPDVITSNTASPQLLKTDPLSVISEAGVLYIDEKAAIAAGKFIACDACELEKQWTAKLYLHNTPHCIAAYLGHLMGLTYLHEVMRYEEFHRVISGAMEEMLETLKRASPIPPQFLEWYAKKELSRFSSELLHDPILRVAREPLRKLELEGRLIGAAQLALSQGVLPENVLTGIIAAMLYESSNDVDKHLPFVGRAITPRALLTQILGLRAGEALEVALRQRLVSTSEWLKQVSQKGVRHGGTDEFKHALEA